jgi:pimeloyl-ACP methyl ester carboxylesterase
MVLQGGSADAEGFDGVAGHLLDRFTFLTFDRRGLSRSTFEGEPGLSRIQTHSDDAHRLLAALTDAPAFVVGCSLGALIGLDLVTRYPGQVRLFIAHEPPAPELLPESERLLARQEQESAEEIYRREGRAAAIVHFMKMTGVNYDDREPDVELPRPNPQAGTNAEFFLAHDAPAARLYRLNVPAIQAASARIVPAAGSTDRALWIHHCAVGLAAIIEKKIVEFPGGHAGFASHPRAFAAKLGELLDMEIKDAGSNRGG